MLSPGRYTMKRYDVVTDSFIINQVTIKELSVEKYAQYPKALKLLYVNKGERKIRGVRFVSDRIEFYEGWNRNSNSVKDLKLIKTFINGYEGLI